MEAGAGGGEETVLTSPGKVGYLPLEMHGEIKHISHSHLSLTHTHTDRGKISFSAICSCYANSTNSSGGGGSAGPPSGCDGVGCGGVGWDGGSYQRC